MRIYSLTGILLLISTFCLGQYDRSAGIRLGHSSGVTFKKFIHAEEALELMLTWRDNGLQVNGLYQFHKPMQFNFTDRVYLYYGVGGHFGYQNKRQLLTFNDPFDRPIWSFRQKTQFVMGVDGLVGMEYRWLTVPMTISIDLKPYFTFVGMRSSELQFWDAAVSFKYVF